MQLWLKPGNPALCGPIPAMLVDKVWGDGDAEELECGSDGTTASKQAAGTSDEEEGEEPAAEEEGETPKEEEEEEKKPASKDEEEEKEDKPAKEEEPKVTSRSILLPNGQTLVVPMGAIPGSARP